jgi:hypothetical protein
MIGGFSTNQGTLDVKKVSNDRDVLARMTYALFWDATVDIATLTELHITNTLKSEMNLKYV